MGGVVEAFKVYLLSKRIVPEKQSVRLPIVDHLVLRISN